MKVTFKLNPELDDNLIYLEVKEKNELINTIILDIESQVTAIECLNNGDKSIQPIHNFIRFISSDKKIFGYTDASKEFSIKYRLYQLEDMLPSQFVRISNTEIINIRAVQQFKLTNTGIIIVHFKNGQQTSSSRRYIKRIKEKLL